MASRKDKKKKQLRNIQLKAAEHGDGMNHSRGIVVKRQRSLRWKFIDIVMTPPYYLICLVLKIRIISKIFNIISHFLKPHEEHITNIISIISLFVYIVLIVYCTVNRNEKGCLFAGLFSLLLTIFLNDNFEKCREMLRQMLMSVLLAIVTFYLLLFAKDYVTLPMKLLFLSLSNLGNTLTMISILITVIINFIKVEPFCNVRRKSAPKITNS